MMFRKLASDNCSLWLGPWSSTFRSTLSDLKVDDDGPNHRQPFALLHHSIFDNMFHCDVSLMR